MKPLDTKAASKVLLAAFGDDPKLEPFGLVDAPGSPNVNFSLRGSAGDYAVTIRRTMNGFLRVQTPSGAVYFGNALPYMDLPAKAKEAMGEFCKQVMPKEVSVKVFYGVAINGSPVTRRMDLGLGKKGLSFPAEASSLHSTRAEAEAAAEKFQRYWDDAQAKPEKKTKKKERVNE